MLREGEVRIPSGCAISGIMNRKGECFSGAEIIRSIALMHDRSNGLGGGFAAYGIYPDYKDHYALHMFYETVADKNRAEEFIYEHFHVDESGKIPTCPIPAISQAPIIWRYFVQPQHTKLVESQLQADEYVSQCVMHINSGFKGSFVVSSGKNMGVFKGVGYPEDIGQFYMLENYKGYIWTAHGRFPTNTPGWWGGAHPFTLLDWSLVHNGEISSYGTNMRYIEMYGYKCTLQTDTEVITYLFDFLLRKHHVPLEVAVAAVAAPFWNEIEHMEPERRELMTAIRAVYGPMLLNGPFSVILCSGNGMMALNDRIKLRSLVAAEQGDRLYVASEEAAIREVCPNPERVWAPKGGEAVVGLLEGVKSL